MTTHKLVLAVTVIAMWVLPFRCEPQEKPEQPGSVIRVSSNLVAVPVLVLDSTGRPVLNLSLTDFRLEKDGKTQKIVRLGDPGAAEIEMALLVDVSGSVRERLTFEEQAAAAFLREVLRPMDAVTVFSIGAQPKLVQARTSNVNEAVGAIMKLEPTREATAFYQSLVEATTYLARAGNPGSRRVL